MDLQPTDFLSGLGGLANLPHPYEDQQQVTQDQQQNQAGQQQLAMGALKLGALQEQQQQAQQYQADVADALKTGKFGALYAKYPEQQKQLQAAHDALDEPTKRATERDLYAVSSFIKSGAVDSAKSLLQKRVDADKAAGLDASDDQQMLDALNSGDPKQVQSAADMALFAILPEDKRAEIYGKPDADHFASTGDNTIYDKRTGKVTRAGGGAPKYMTIKNADGSESIVQVGGAEGGGQASGGGAPSGSGGAPLTGAGIETAALTAIPGITTTSRARTPEHNAAVGGVPNSYHLTDQARDFVPPAGMSMNQLAVTLKQAIPGAKILNEGTHVHVQAPEREPEARFNQAGTKVLYTSKGNPGGAAGNAPSGYRFKGDGTLEPIPGGPSDVDKLPQEAVQSMAQQYLAGDKTVLQGLGRGKQGGVAIAQVRSEIAKQANALGMSGRDIAAQMADFAGVVASERATGTRIAQVDLAATEAEKLIPLALAASDALPRNGFTPFSRAQQAVRSGNNNPALRRFVTANNALVNVYARAVSPTGAPTVSGTEHARELLDTAYDIPSYRAVVAQMHQEIDAAKQAPKQVRSDLRASVGGGIGVAAPAPPPDVLAILKKYGHR